MEQNPTISMFNGCMQDTFAMLARRTWPMHYAAARPSVRATIGYFVYKFNGFHFKSRKTIYMVPQHQIFHLNIMQFCINGVLHCIQDTILLYTRYPIVARRAWPAGFRPSASRKQRYLAYKPYWRTRLVCPSAREGKIIVHTKLN